MNRLHIRYGRRWDLVASGGKLEDLAKFSIHFPGRQWKVTSPEGKLLTSGRAPKAEPETPILEQLLAGFQDRLVDEINDKRNTSDERTGLRMASAIFRNELARLGIPNVPVREIRCSPASG
jgi:hypothetical protein